MTINIYAWSFSKIYAIVIFCILVWMTVNYSSSLAVKRKFIWKFVNFVFLVFAVISIMLYTVLNRISSETHQFTFFADIGDEFYREMLMNAFLYFPFGLTLSTLIGPVSILLGLVLSSIIEYWQYTAGTGLAQGTDILMNTLGTVVGATPWILVRFGTSERIVLWGKGWLRKTKRR